MRKLSPILLVLLIGCAGSARNKNNFDVVKWANNQERNKMASTIINGDLIKNKNYSEVINILGTPEKFPYPDINEPLDTNNCKLGYTIDNCNVIDTQFLVIVIENGKVTRIYKDCYR